MPMSLDQFQRVLARLSTDSLFRKRFFANREEQLAAYALSPEEFRGLCGLSQTQVERFARSLQIKRQTEVQELIPASVKRLGEQWPRLFALHCDRYLPQGTLKPGDDAHTFLISLARSPVFSFLEREFFRWEAFRFEHCTTSRPRRWKVFFCLPPFPSSETVPKTGAIRPGITLSRGRRGDFRSFSFPPPVFGKKRFV